MTKAEQQHIENLQRELCEAKALRWSGLAMPERMQIPKTGYVNGWIERACERDAVEAWTENKYHGYGVRTTKKSKDVAMHGGERLFVTKLEALTALRLVKEQEFAEMLAVIDQDIENARAYSITVVEIKPSSEEEFAAHNVLQSKGEELMRAAMRVGLPSVKAKRAPSCKPGLRFKGVLLAPAIPETPVPVYSIRLGAVMPKKRKRK